MSRLLGLLDHSRLARVQQQLAAGEEVDTVRVLALQALDMARVGELFALEALQAEDRADEQFGQLVQAP